MPDRKRRLLVVDDEVGLQKLVRRFVEAAGHDVWAAHSIAEALALAASTAPDAILVDLGLPDGSGIDVVAGLKQNPETATIPVVVWSGSDVVEGSAKAFEAGAVAYFDKIELPGLMLKLGELLKGQR
jgi:two-component system, OmpR family, KDP operon response regulator KdpE